jgi:hypothetical protein
MPRLVLVMNDGSEIESSFVPPYSVREQVAFEEHWRISFVAVYKSVAAAAEAAGDASAVPDELSFKIGWILWFGWHRARPKVAAKFDTFLGQLADWRTEEEEGDAALAEAATPKEPAPVDPTSAVAETPTPSSPKRKPSVRKAPAINARAKETTALRSVQAG